MSTYPEHAKLTAIQDQSQLIGEFLDWLTSERKPRLILCESMDSIDRPFVPITEVFYYLLAEYFEIDLKKLDEEKDAMLAEIRERHDAEKPS